MSTNTFLPQDRNRAGETLRVRIVLPFRLPTWNEILSMPFKQRIMVKKFIRDFVATSIQSAGGSQTGKGSTIKPRLTESQEAEYGRMMDHAMWKRTQSHRKKRC